jgi:hypothetical protein
VKGLEKVQVKIRMLADLRKCSGGKDRGMKTDVG